LDDPTDSATAEFTPEQAGEFQFFCAHLMYKGLMTVREG
jgi:plastocyanin domain-containing protein